MIKKYIRSIMRKREKSLDPDTKSHYISKKPDPAITYASLSDKGLQRTSNQDSYGVFPEDRFAFLEPKGQLFIVADGVGGQTGVKKTSEVAINIVRQVYFADQTEEVSISLRRALESANEKIFHNAGSGIPFQKFGSTCTALVLTKDHAYIAHIGDSRIYRISNNNIEQLTQDHTEVEEKLRTGFLTKDEAKNHPERSILSRALGVELIAEVDIQENIPLRSGDYYALCTDGLGKVSPEEIKDIVLSNSPQEACELLVQLANQRGGEDNITVQVVRINQTDK